MKKEKIAVRSKVSLIIILSIIIDVICYVIASNPDYSYISLDMYVYVVLFTIYAVVSVFLILKKTKSSINNIEEKVYKTIINTTPGHDPLYYKGYIQALLDYKINI